MSANTAVFKAILYSDGRFVAAIAAIPEGQARFFIAQRGEDAETFIGRVSVWVKAQGAEGLEMAEPDVLMEGLEASEVVMRLKHKMGVGRQADAPEYDVENLTLEWGDAIDKASVS